MILRPFTRIELDENHRYVSADHRTLAWLMNALTLVSRMLSPVALVVYVYRLVAAAISAAARTSAHSVSRETLVISMACVFLLLALMTFVSASLAGQLSNPAVGIVLGFLVFNALSFLMVLLFAKLQEGTTELDSAVAEEVARLVAAQVDLEAYHRNLAGALEAISESRVTTQEIRDDLSSLIRSFENLETTLAMEPAEPESQSAPELENQ